MTSQDKLRILLPAAAVELVLIGIGVMGFVTTEKLWPLLVSVVIGAAYMAFTVLTLARRMRDGR
jgi:hypothetical protein